jgi:hypothetical protein
MDNLNVKHYLECYRTRKEMQEAGITNPTDEIKILTKTIVDKLSHLPQDEKIELINNKMIDSKGNIIVTFPKSRTK